MKSKLAIVLILSSISLFAQKRGKFKKCTEKISETTPLYSYNLDSLLLKKDTSESTFKTEYDITKEIDLVTDSIASLNKKISYIKGYKVIAYSGSSQNVALEIRKKILKSFEQHPDFKSVSTDFVWHQPTFRIYVGSYQKRLSAVRMAEFLKAYQFNFEDEEITINPLVVPSKISIRD